MLIAVWGTQWQQRKNFLKLTTGDHKQADHLAYSNAMHVLKHPAKAENSVVIYWSLQAVFQKNFDHHHCVPHTSISMHTKFDCISTLHY